MEAIVTLGFRFFMYVIFGLSLESIFAVLGISKAVGERIESRAPKKYLEGFVSLYMIPIHGFGVLFGFEPIFGLIEDWFILWRYLVWCIMITLVEALAGFIYDQLLGFYSWDYYEKSKYKVFKRGYTLWTLVPLWGIAGLMLELYVKIMLYVSPHILSILK